MNELQLSRRERIVESAQRAVGCASPRAPHTAKRRMPVARTTIGAARRVRCARRRGCRRSEARARRSARALPRAWPARAPCSYPHPTGHDQSVANRERRQRTWHNCRHATSSPRLRLGTDDFLRAREGRGTTLCAVSAFCLPSSSDARTRARAQSFARTAAACAALSASATGPRVSGTAGRKASSPVVSHVVELPPPNPTPSAGRTAPPRIGVARRHSLAFVEVRGRHPSRHLVGRTSRGR
jgi:hypothetical protein